MARFGRYKVFTVIGTILMPVASGLIYLFDIDSGQEVNIKKKHTQHEK